jgi:hypothetical protein
MFFNPQYGSPYYWKLNTKFNTKQQWHLAYESNFIAAEKENELII